MAFGEGAAASVTSGEDESGLGRWSWMLFQGAHNNKTRIISAYKPCRTGPSGLRTVFNQQRRYFRSIGRKGNPRTLFNQDLQEQLVQWRQGGEKLIVCIDANESAYNGTFKEALSIPELGMQEVISAKHPDLPETPTFCAGDRSGRHQIDGIWATPDLPINKGTWLAIHKSPGDHRYGVIDIAWEVLIGQPRYKTIRPPARRLSCNHPKAPKNYRGRFKRQLKYHKIQKKLHAIYEEANYPLTEDQQQQLEKIAQTKEEIMINAEKRCRKMCMGSVAFTPEVSKAKKTVTLWRMVKARRQGFRRSSGKIRRLAKSCDVRTPLSVTLAQAKGKLKEAEHYYKSIKPKARAMRDRWLRERTNDDSLSESARKHAARSLKIEQQRNCARRIKQVLGHKRAGAIAKVEFLNEDGTYSTVDIQEEVEDAIMKNNEARFRLTEATPFMQEPLRSEVGFFGATEAAQQMLDGTYECPEGTDEFTRHFVEALKKANDDRDTISTRISNDDYISYWRKAREQTSSSYSGLHFGHYKAAAFDAWLSEIQALSIEIAYANGYSYKRWQQGISAMLEKKEGVIKVDKLRAILLMEADFNFANKLIFGNRMMWEATERDEIPDEVFGSIKDREAIEAATCRRLVADLSRMTRTPMAISSVDAQTCYDRMIHSIASICCQRWNVPKEAIISALGTIQKMKFYLRTSFGDSDDYYGGGEVGLPFQGGCQGNGGAPALWIAISVILIRVLKKHGHVVEWKSAISGVVVMLIGFLFVDDTDLIVMAQNTETNPEEVMTMMQHNITEWYQALRHSGGALHPGKCSWYLMAYTWRPCGKWEFHSKESLPGTIVVPALDGTPTIIERHEPSEPTTAVGVTQAMDGSMQAQLEVLKERADEWAQGIREGWLPRNLAWAALRQNIWASLKYPLPACTFSPQEADTVLCNFYKTLLPGLGVCRKVSTAVRHAPSSRMGLDLPHVYTEQGIGQLKYFTMSAHLPNLLGSLHRACLEQAHLEVGVDDIFALPFDRYGFLLTGSLVKSMWEFISSHSITLQGDLARPQLQRLGDEFLMPLMVQSGILTTRELVGFNRVRVDLQAITLADITEGDGIRLSSWAKGIRKSDNISSKWRWPKEVPGAVDKKAWEKGIAILEDPGTQFLPQQYHLGPWIREPHRENWHWRFDRQNRHLYGKFLNSHWRRYSPRSRFPPRHGSIFLRDNTSTDPPPDDTELATAWVDDRGQARFGGSAELIREPVAAAATSIHEVVSRWASGWPLDHSTFPDGGLTLAQAIIAGTAQGVCDGSYKPSQADFLGAASFILEDARRVIDSGISPGSCRGVVRTSGTKDEVNPYRSELQGIHTILLAIKAVCMLHQITSGKAKLACDNKLAADLSDKNVLRVPSRWNHADLIRAIRKIKSELPIEIEFSWVEGHQDDDIALEDLPRMAQLNVHADRMAKDHLDTLIAQSRTAEGLGPCDDRIEGEGWTIRLGCTKITGDPTLPLRDHVLSPPLRRYLAKKGILATNSFDRVDWDATAKAIDTYPPLFRLWAAKHVHNWSGVAQRMKEWKFWDSDICPCCHNTVETTRHVAICPDERLLGTWTEKLDGLEAWLEDTDTDPNITSCIMVTLRTRSPLARFEDNAAPSIAMTARAQDIIGWHNLLEGRISKLWRTQQHRHYLAQRSLRSSDKWARDLVCNLLEVSHAMWTKRNSIVHEKAANGLRMAEAQQLEDDIRMEFELGHDGLHENDKWLLNDGIESVLSLTGYDQQTWLTDIRLAREEYEAELAHEAHQLAQAIAVP